MEPDAFLVKLVEHNPYPTWISDAEGTLIRLNQACRDLFHTQDHEVVGKYNVFWDEVMEAQGFLPVIKQVFENGKSARFCSEYDTARLKNLDLQERVSLVMEVTIVPIFDDRERVTHAIFQHIDITETKRAEERLRESESKYRGIFETTGAATIIVEEDMTISLANAELEKLSGYSRKEVEGKKKWTDFVAREDLAKMEKYHAARRKDPGSAPRTYEFRLLDRQGNVKDVFLTVALIAGTKKSIASILDITERKRAEEALRESEERWQFALEGSGDGVWDWNPQTNKVHFSRQWKTMLGYEEWEIGDNLDEWAKRVHPDDYPGVLAEIDKHFNGETPVYISEHRLLCKGGGYRWILDRGKLVRRTEDGKPLRVIGTHTDITERKRAEEAQHRSEETAKRLAMENEVVAEIGRIVSSTVDIENVYESFVQVAKKIIRFDRIAVTLFNPEEMTFFIPYVAGVDVPVYRRGSLFPLTHEWLEATLRDHRGKIFQLRAAEEAQAEEKIKRLFPAFLPQFQAGLRSAMMVPLFSNDQFIGSLDFHGREFEAYAESDQIIAEKIANQIAGAVANAQLFQKQKRTEEELFKSNERYRLLVDLSPLMVLTHRQGKYVFANAAAARALGASSAEELAGKSIYEVIHPDYRDLAKERIRQAEQGKSVPPVEEKYIRLDKKVIDVELNHVQVLDQDGPTFLVMAQDITEQKKAEKERAALEEQLQQAQKVEAIGTLAGGIAHDFNNILAGILGYAELAGLETPEDSKIRYNLEQCIKSAQRAKELVQQILTFSRQGEQERKPLDIGPIIKEALKFLRSSLPATIEIRQEIEEDPGAIEANPTQVYQVLMNLCTNAAHAMADQGGVLEVSLAEEDLGKRMPGVEPGSYLRLRVRDTGRGMSPDILKKIFDPYFTTKEVGKGTGLGLSVVHGIVKSYGGGIAVSSEAGKGSTFDIYFPRIEAPGPALEAAKAEPLPLGGQERILFVDDEQMIAEFGQRALEHLGYEVFARTSSVEALELFRAKADQLDLVITDMTMPNLTGDKLAQMILEIRPGIPIILCTGFSEHMSEQKAQALGIREFVMKPLVMKDLAKAVRKALDSRKDKKAVKKRGQAGS